MNLKKIFTRAVEVTLIVAKHKIYLGVMKIHLNKIRGIQENNKVNLI